jgi:hypothetical protein
MTDVRVTARMAYIEAEYGEPAREVIEGLRAQGCSWQTVAGALGMDCKTLTHLRKRLGMLVDPSDRQMDADREPMPLWADLQAQKHGYENIGTAVEAMRLGERLTVREIAAKLGVSVTTVQVNTPPEAKGVVNWSVEGKERQRENARRLAKTRRNRMDHPWRRPLTREVSA